MGVCTHTKIEAPLSVRGSGSDRNPEPRDWFSYEARA